MCALLASPFKTRKPRQFEYRPRYYDPDKEAWEQRRRELLGDEAVTPKKGTYHPGQYVEELRFRRGILAEQKRQQKSRAGMSRLLILVVLLALIAWYMFG